MSGLTPAKLRIKRIILGGVIILIAKRKNSVILVRMQWKTANTDQIRASKLVGTRSTFRLRQTPAPSKWPKTLSEHQAKRPPYMPLNHNNRRQPFV